MHKSINLTHQLLLTLFMTCKSMETAMLLKDNNTDQVDTQKPAMNDVSAEQSIRNKKANIGAKNAQNKGGNFRRGRLQRGNAVDMTNDDEANKKKEQPPPSENESQNETKDTESPISDTHAALNNGKCDNLQNKTGSDASTTTNAPTQHEVINNTTPSNTSGPGDFVDVVRTTNRPYTSRFPISSSSQYSYNDSTVVCDSVPTPEHRGGSNIQTTPSDNDCAFMPSGETTRVWDDEIPSFDIYDSINEQSLRPRRLNGNF